MEPILKKDGFFIFICYVFIMTNVSILPVDPYLHLRHFFGDRFIIVSLKPSGEAGYVIGTDISVEDMAFLSKLVGLISDEFIKDNMGV